MRHAAAVRRFANPRIVPRSGRFDRPNPIVGGWFALVIGAILGSATGICCASGGALWLEVEALAEQVPPPCSKGGRCQIVIVGLFLGFLLWFLLELLH